MKTVQLWTPALLLAVAVAEEGEDRRHLKLRGLKSKKDSSSDYGSYYGGVNAGVYTNAPVTSPPATSPPIYTMVTMTPIQDSGQGGSVVEEGSGSSTGGSETTDVGDRSDGTSAPTQGGIVLEDGSTMTSSGLIEYYPCISAEDSAVQTKLLDSRGDFSCQYNSCRGGCCREFDAFFLCDESNDYPKRNCLCNENTYQRAFALTPANQTGIVVNVTTTNSTSPPTTRDSGTDGSIAVPITNGTGTTVNVEEQCLPQFRGQNWGIHPADTTSLPTWVLPGDCYTTSHCLPSSLAGAQVCCK